jgi:hypothetical protein
MTLHETYHKLVDIGEQADLLCRSLPGHRLHMALRDLSLAIEHAAKALSQPTLEAIAGS